MGTLGQVRGYLVMTPDILKIYRFGNTYMLYVK